MADPRSPRPDVAEEVEVAGPPPFFIVGCGRSGTTLLRAMLNSHSQLAVPLESLFIVDYLEAPDDVSAATLRRMLPREHEIREWGLDVRPEDLEGCETAAGMIERLHRMYARKHGKRSWGQKTPRLVRHADLLRSAFPGCRFVHLVRDPRAVVASLIRSDVHRSNAYFGARRWVRDVEAGRRCRAADPAGVLEVRYEDLVTRPEETLRQVTPFLGVAFEPGMLRYAERAEEEYGPYYDRIHARLTEAPDPSRVDAWRSRLPRRDVRVVESVCRELMEEYGYELVTEARRPSRPYVALLRLERVVGFLRQLLHYLRFRRGYLHSVIRRKRALSSGLGEILTLSFR